MTLLEAYQMAKQTIREKRSDEYLKKEEILMVDHYIETDEYYVFSWWPRGCKGLDIGVDVCAVRKQDGQTQMWGTWEYIENVPLQNMKENKRLPFDDPGNLYVSAEDLV